MNLTNQEKHLFKSKTPEKFIVNSIKLKIPSGRKAYICKLWLNENNNYTIDDIGYARNRHPYWKKRKRGDITKKIKRLKEYNYIKKRKQHWSKDDLLKFIAMDEKDRSGNYKYKDRELAKIFKSSIPGIQHIRRKMNLAIKILNKQQTKITKKNIFNFVYNYAEDRLRKLLKSLNKKK